MSRAALAWTVGVCLLAMGSALAQRIPPAELAALSHVQSAFFTGADAGVMAFQVAVAPELQRSLGLPARADGPKVYEALIGMIGSRPFDARRMTPAEIAAYGARPGLEPVAQFPIVVESGDLRLLVQYDARATTISYVGQLGVDAPAPPAPPVKPKAKPKPKAEAPPPGPRMWTVQFSYKSAALSNDARATLEDAARGANRRFAVSAYTDGIGSAQYNQALSEKRAEAVRAYLVGQGIPRDGIAVSLLADAQPVQSCAREKSQRARRDCEAPNRRVVIEATP